MKEHKIYKHRLALFWYRDGKLDFISDAVAIEQIGRVVGERSEIVFECRPDGFGFFNDLSGYIEVKHNLVMITNPHDGDLVCTIHDMKLSSFGIREFTSFEPDSDELTFWMRVECDVDWHIFTEHLNNGDEILA